MRALCAEALARAAGAPESLRAPVQAALATLGDARWRALFSGLCSAGKSSLVCALWGDSELLPTAVRDCTQTNTLARRPAPGESDRSIRLAYLEREKAVDFASRDLSCYRLFELLHETESTLAAMLEELPPEERLRHIAARVRRLFREKPGQLVLHEPLTEELDRIEEFLAYIDSPGFKPGQAVPAEWNERREWLMGRRHLDGRTFDTGKLLALRHIELLRETHAWPVSGVVNGAQGEVDGAPGAPELIDSPWIPAFHNARRADLILEQARSADILVIVALPQHFELEPWVGQIFRARPELPARTIVVFNQIDTLDTAALFSREGFAAQFEENRERLARGGIRAENLLLSCARLPFLEGLPADTLAVERIERLKKVLQRVARACEGRGSSDFACKLRRAADPADAGIELLRERLLAMAGGTLRAARPRQALQAVDGLLAHLGESAADLRAHALSLDMALRQM